MGLLNQRDMSLFGANTNAIADIKQRLLDSSRQFAATVEPLVSRVEESFAKEFNSTKGM